MKKLELKISDNKLVIKGYLKTLSHFDEVVEATKKIKKNHKSIKVDIVDSFSLNSSFIIYFLELIEDKIDIEMRVKDKRLYETLKKLNLIKKFRVSKF